MAFTYILRCADGTVYVGHTDDLSSREKAHNEGRGAAYTAARRPVEMVYAEKYVSIKSAISTRTPSEALDTQEEGSPDHRQPHVAEIDEPPN